MSKWNFKTNYNERTKKMTVVANATMTEMIDSVTLERLINRIVEELTKLFIEKYADEVLAKLTPDEVGKKVKELLAKQILEVERYE